MGISFSQRCPAIHSLPNHDWFSPNILFFQLNAHVGLVLQFHPLSFIPRYSSQLFFLLCRSYKIHPKPQVIPFCFLSTRKQLTKKLYIHISDNSSNPTWHDLGPSTLLFRMRTIAACHVYTIMVSRRKHGLALSSNNYIAARGWKLFISVVVSQDTSGSPKHASTITAIMIFWPQWMVITFLRLC